MRFPAWRLALTGGAIIVLAIAGIGFAAASEAPAGTGGAAAQAATTGDEVLETDLELELAADVESNAKLGARDGAKLKRILRLGRHLVHAEVTVTDKDGNLVNLQLDHGTVQSIGGGVLVIAEAGGGTETVSTSDATKVRVGRELGDLGDVTVGAEVFVQSRIDGGTVLAKRIIVIPAAT
jgi:hypothetical protein